MLSPEAQIEVLRRGTAQIVSEAELAARLALSRPLRVKLGVDPTSPDLHVGHGVAMTKLRQFQDLGHQVVLIIGDFTAGIGDPSGRTTTRPPLTPDAIRANAETYTTQAFKILDRDRTEVVWNGDWFRKMTFEHVLRLNSRVTMQQMLQREDFRDRIDSGREIRLHEIQYPVMQGWDSVEVRSDVEIGGTDQLFNILVGRDLQKEEGQPPQIVMTMPLLEGLDGVRKMSKSYGNYIGLAEPPDEIFGKAMSVSDELMAKYFRLLLDKPVPDGHPMDAKKQLAAALVARYHSAAAAAAARDSWDARFSRRDLGAADLPEFAPGADRRIVAVCAAAFSDAFALPRSNADIRRLLQGNSIRLNDTPITDPKAEPPFANGDILRLDKKHAVRIRLEP